MSKAIFWQYDEFIQSRKEKIINMLISEIVFLKTRVKNAKNRVEISYLKKALNKLDYLVNKLKDNSSDLPEGDFDKMIMLIYNIFRDIAENLEEKIEV